MYDYFIAYRHSSQTSGQIILGFGNCHAELDEKITSFGQIQELQNSIEAQEGMHNIVIINYQLLS